jgi:hypothetical protein
MISVQSDWVFYGHIDVMMNSHNELSDVCSIMH